MDRLPVDPVPPHPGAPANPMMRSREARPRGRESHVSKRKLGALAVPVIAVLAILVATQVFSIGGATTKQPAFRATTGENVTPEAAAQGGETEAGAEPNGDADAEHQDELEQ